jgi:hypothetical protein
MERQGSGHVVQISTSLVDHAMTGVPSVLASLTKGGLNGATKSLAIEYATRGIRVNAISLGIIKSPMHPVKTYPQLDGLHPVGHMGEMSDVVDAILYLETAGFVTGEILHVDGGQARATNVPEDRLGRYATDLHTNSLLIPDNDPCPRYHYRLVGARVCRLDGPFCAETQDDAIRAFRVNIPEADLVDLRRGVAATRWPDRELVTDQSQT